MCVDANAGVRFQAKQRAIEKEAKFNQRALQFYNKETSYKRALNRNILGFTRDVSDAYVKALYTQGRGRRAKQTAASRYFAKKKVNEGGRSRRFGRAQYVDLLQKQSQVDSIVRNTFGSQMAYAQTQAQRKFLSQNARARESLGVPAAYGAPVLMPPTDRLTGALNIASSIASIVAPFTSDIRAKENIKQVGVSPQGYKIYEFNYIGGDVRFRGAMAQDVLKKNPMAVGIDQNYLTVDYSKIDVAMEVV